MRKMYKDLSELPMTLSAKHLMDILGMCKGNAYELMNSENFPSVRVSKRRLVVSKAAFEKWFYRERA